MSAEEKVASQAAIEVLHQRTRSDRLLGQRSNRKLNRMEPTPELFSLGRFLGPAPGVTLVTRLRFEHPSCEFRRNLQLLSELLQILIEPACEGKQIVALVLQSAADRLEPVGALRGPGLQLGHDKIIQVATLGVTRAGDRENVVA